MVKAHCRTGKNKAPVKNGKCYMKEGPDGKMMASKKSTRTGLAYVKAHTRGKKK